MNLSVADHKLLTAG